MSGFESDWLSLREPADRAARASELLEAAAAHVASGQGAVVDLGCGTGSTFRALDPQLRPETPWVFVDDDEALLARAHMLLPPAGRDRVRLHTADLAGFDDEIFQTAALVTASAVFDLVSSSFIEDLAERMARRGLALYAALTVDGRIVWDSPHPLDDEIVKAFSLDQQRDKGFGPGLGGGAAVLLEAAFVARGYRVQSATSDWTLGVGDLALQDAFHEGLAAPARAAMHDEVTGWLRHRRETARAGCGVRVGHRDMLALPPARHP
ncbi:trans-aconitate methyltransferase [Aureimonas sp. SA4125]|uniref:class I SAM-dependent methyltransferase n=1 Tax=Aureimonas sp. SA4125 TaxID=2826993 RepID=UPI001CC7A8CB|nr:class I SAM-dependent methyltransferase [Aureimonas sp. SA4125]BDA86454.1 trans-aconitate methyltransferase [Aureimonas sp. SA4125]